MRRIGSYVIVNKRELRDMRSFCQERYSGDYLDGLLRAITEILGEI